MGKETFVGGETIYATGGDYKEFGFGIERNAKQVIQNAKDDIVYGEAVEAPFIEFNTGIDLYVEFEPLTSYDGEFGFDWLKVDSSDTPLKVQTDDIGNLEFVYDNSKQEYSSVSALPNLKNEIKKEYKQFPLKVPYYIPWLSLIQIGQEIKLNMICKPIKSGEDITKEEVSFGKNEYYEVIIDGQKNENIKYTPDGNPKEITIKCIKPSKEIGIVAVDTNGKEIGKITAIDNTKIFELPVRLVCVVKDTANKEADITQLISDFKSEKIEDYLNKNSLNQALIKTTVEIDNKYHIAFDETIWSGTFYDKTGDFFTNRKDSSGGKVSYIKDDGKEQKDAEYEHILDKFLRDYKAKFETDGKKFKGILLFVSNIAKDPADKEGGVSRTKPVNFREAIVFKPNLKDKNTYAHEIAHALGLEHYFWRDAEYKKELEDIKKNIEDNIKTKKKNEEALKSNNESIKVNKDAKKANETNINTRNTEIKKWKTEKAKPTYPYKNEAQERINYLIEENKKTKVINDKADEYIKRNEKYNEDIKKTNEEIDKNLKSQRDNLDVSKKNKFKFKEGSNLNIMDYNGKKNNYTHWQWDIMQNDVKLYYGNIIENK